jgi:hypothetical protein
MPDHDDIAAPQADRYGHPKGVNLMTLTPGSHDHGVGARQSDRYGHVRKFPIFEIIPKQRKHCVT